MRLDQVPGRLLTVTRRIDNLVTELRDLRYEKMRLEAHQDVLTQFPEPAAEAPEASAEGDGAAVGVFTGSAGSTANGNLHIKIET